MAKVKMIQPHLQSEIDTVINNLLSTCEQYKDVLPTIKGYVTKTNRGIAYFDTGIFTVPLRAYEKQLTNGDGYFIWQRL